eukprot:759954-Hanusia_phi.AAC.1
MGDRRLKCVLLRRAGWNLPYMYFQSDMCKTLVVALQSLASHGTIDPNCMKLSKPANSRDWSTETLSSWLAVLRIKESLSLDFLTVEPTD